MPTKTASLYCRVSTNQQTASNQERDLREFCTRQGWEIKKVYIDEGFSGRNDKRPALQQMLKDSQGGKCGDLIACTKIDRIARSTMDLLQIMQTLSESGVGFCSASQGINTQSSTGKMLVQLLGVISEFESSLIADRVRSGIKRSREDNPTKSWGRPRCGFNVNECLKLKQDGMSWSKLAKHAGVSASSLQRTLYPLLQKPVATQ